MYEFSYTHTHKNVSLYTEGKEVIKVLDLKSDHILYVWIRYEKYDYNM